MSNPKYPDHGIGYVVDNKESKARYAVSPGNFNPKIHEKVRPLQPGETVLGFSPKRIRTKTSDSPLSGPAEISK